MIKSEKTISGLMLQFFSSCAKMEISFVVKRLMRDVSRFKKYEKMVLCLFVFFPLVMEKLSTNNQRITHCTLDLLVLLLFMLFLFVFSIVSNDP